MATHVTAPASVAAFAAAKMALWRPSRPLPKCVASLYLAPAAMTRLSTPWPDAERLRGQTEAACDDFIENGLPPRGLFKSTFGRTAIAQMEVLAPKPGTRLFGAFVESSRCFVVLRLMLRDELPFKPTGQIGIVDYRALGEQLVAEWDRLLPGVPRRPLKELRR